MALITHVRGILLEEDVLHLLRGSGYSTVESVGTDPSLAVGPAGLEVIGRGGRHQIDAIADFLIVQPFSYPQRLLVEAKCYSGTPVDLPIARNAVGVLKDVSEFWVPGSGTIAPKKRYHYQYALFSASGYTDRAESYAFAQDIYLIPLAGSQFFRSAIGAIFSINAMDFGASHPMGSFDVDLKQLREQIRVGLKTGNSHMAFMALDTLLRNKLNDFVTACCKINFAMLAVIGGSFPVFLVPAEDLDINNLLQGNHLLVRITWDRDGWYLSDALNKKLFSFDLPSKLFKLYAEEGTLTQRAALALKEGEMSQFQAISSLNGQLKVLNFRLDSEWFGSMKRRVDEVEAIRTP